MYVLSTALILLTRALSYSQGCGAIRVLRLILRQGMSLVLTGMILGMVASVFADSPLIETATRRKHERSG